MSIAKRVLLLVTFMEVLAWLTLAFRDTCVLSSTFLGLRTWPSFAGKRPAQYIYVESCHNDFRFRK